MPASQLFANADKKAKKEYREGRQESLKNHEKALEDLKNSDILNDFKEICKSKTKRGRKAEFDTYVSNIVNRFNYVKETSSLRDHAKDYLKKLEKDYRKLSTIKTQQSNVEKIRELLKYKIEIGKKYIKRSERQRSKKEYGKDLLVMELVKLFKDLKYEKKIELISNLCIYFACSNVICCREQGKKKIKQYYPSGYTEGKIKIESRWVNSKSESIENKEPCSDFGKIQDSNCLYKFCFREELAISKRWNRANKFSLNDLEERVEKEKKKYTTFNLLEIPSILKDLKIPKAKWPEIYDSILDDLEFQSAFIFSAPEKDSTAC